MDTMEMKNFSLPSNFMGEKEGSPFIPITNPDRNPGQIDLKCGAERSGKNKGEIELPLPHGAADLHIFPDGPNPTPLLKRNNFIHTGKCLP
jgi:hypothetical protein